MIATANNVQMQGVYVNVPAVDWSLFRELIRKFGWQAETRDQLLDRFVSSRPADPAISEEEIMDEVRAVRYEKTVSQDIFRIVLSKYYGYIGFLLEEDRAEGQS